MKSIAVDLDAETETMMGSCRRKITDNWNVSPEKVTDYQVIQTALLVLDGEARVVDVVPSH